MNQWLDFLASVIDSLAWPFVLAFALYLLRRELRALIPFLRRVRLGALDAEFGERVEQLEKKAEEADLPEGEEEGLVRIQSPRGIVLEAWIEVEREANIVAEQLGIKGPNPTFRVFRELEKGDIGRRELVSILRDLRGLRNQAVHAQEFDLSLERALEYASLARRATAALAASQTQRPQD